MPHLARSRRLARSVAFAALCAAPALTLAPAAHAATASEVVTSGSLSFINSTPSDVTFPAATLTGFDLLRSQSQTFDVNDASGSGSGWSISATSTQFKAGTHLLPVNSATILSPPTDVCDASSTCTIANNSVPYPYTIPSGSPTAPTATKMFNATAGTGQGQQTITPTWNLGLPAVTWAGGAGNPYISTWTFTLVTGP